MFGGNFMKWNEMRRSSNVEDKRGQSQVPRRAGTLGLGGMLLVIVLSLVFGINPNDILALFGAGGGPAPTTNQPVNLNDEGSDFIRAILGDTEDIWNEIFRQSGSDYQEPKLVLFSDAAQSACGFASAAVGPFYCPGDEKVYIDLSFFRQLNATAAEEGDFARAYVIAHEVAHHIQNQLNISDQVQRQRARADEVTGNRLSVMLELQADCLAGVWGHYAWQRNIITPKDIETALLAATEIGDDHLQKQARGYVVPEAFTHGSSAQRVQWFKTGLENGDMQQCDTFAELE